MLELFLDKEQFYVHPALFVQRLRLQRCSLPDTACEHRFSLGLCANTMASNLARTRTLGRGARSLRLAVIRQEKDLALNSQ